MGACQGNVRSHPASGQTIGGLHDDPAGHPEPPLDGNEDQAASPGGIALRTILGL